MNIMYYIIMTGILVSVTVVGVWIKYHHHGDNNNNMDGFEIFEDTNSLDTTDYININDKEDEKEDIEEIDDDEDEDFLL